jgi:hypothetical protein
VLQTSPVHFRTQREPGAAFPVIFTLEWKIMQAQAKIAVLRNGTDEW